MIQKKIKIACILFFLAISGGYAQQTCYQIGLNEGREIYNEAQRLERSGRCIEAVPRFWEALRRFRLTRTCRDLPSNHELDTWEGRCIQGMTACGGKIDESTFLIAAPSSLTFPESGGEQQITVNTSSGSWRVDRSPSWCTIQRSNNRLTITCKENDETISRSDRLVIVANALTYEIAIAQNAKTPEPETPVIPDLEPIKITEVKVLPPPVIDEITADIIPDETLVQAPLSPPPASPISSTSPVSSSSGIKIGIGAKAGLNLATISNKMTDLHFSPEMKPDFHAGIFLNLNFGYRNHKPGVFSLQPEVLYSRQGFTVDGRKIAFDYITVPLMIKMNVYEGVNIELGPWISYLFSVSPNAISIDRNTIRLSDLKSGKDVGVAAGIGYEAKLGWVAGVRYQHGLSDMAGNLPWINRNIALSLGWKF
ncbi:MAG: outer membrane beta-barrel protein [Tannerella sp.]|jgi:hypothetical protein|nr:outer membrane beta-barrel protein [Tannerella sp.]